MVARPGSNRNNRGMLGDLISETIVKTKAALSEPEKEARLAGHVQLLELLEQQMAGRLGEVLADVPVGDNEPGIVSMMRGLADVPDNSVDVILQILLFIPFAISAAGTMATAAFGAFINEFNGRFLYVQLSPEQAAVAVNRGIISSQQGLEAAATNNVGATTFDWLTDIQGETIGIEQANSLFQRQLITDETLNEIYGYSNLNPKWYSVAKFLQYDTMSSSDAIETYIKGETDYNTAQNLFIMAGGQADQFDLLWKAAGNPIGVEQALSLYNHGYISDTDVDAVIAHSRINPQFAAMAKDLRFKFLSPYQIISALKAGDATADQATGWLLAQGYPADQVKAVVSGAATPAATTAKNLTQAIILETYEAGLSNEAQATEQLEALGYHAAAIPIILESYAARRILSAATTVITQIKKQFLAGQITSSVASGLLDQVGVQSVIRDAYLKDWAVEAQVEQRSLTEAQIGDMAKKGIISYGYAAGRWSSLGYGQDDIVLLAAYYGDGDITIPVA